MSNTVNDEATTGGGPGTGPRQRAVLVLGAGRSGTSIVTRAAQAIGIELGDDFKPPSRKNPTGFFEDKELLRLSKKLRRALGLRPDSLRLVDEAVWDGLLVRPFYAEFAAAIETRFGAAAVWGFKYARTMRLLPFWVRLFDAMDIEPSYVMPVRNPLSVARSRAQLDAQRGEQENSDLEWLVNVVPYFHLVRDRRLVVVDYDRLMAGPEAALQRMAAGLDLPLDDACREGIDEFCTQFLRPGLRHTRFGIDELMRDERINPLLREAYCLLDRLAADELDSSSEELWQAWASIRGRLEALRPLLARFDWLAGELRRARWNPLSPLPAARALVRQLMSKL